MTGVWFLPAALVDVRTAYAWYEQERAGLGDEFLEAVKSAVDRVLSFPLSSPVVHRDARRCLVERFPYCLFYRALWAALSSSPCCTRLEALTCRRAGCRADECAEWRAPACCACARERVALRTTKRVAESGHVRPPRLEAGKPIPEPSRAYTVPAAPEHRPAKEWPAVMSPPERSAEEASSSWADRAVVYTNNVLVEESEQEPRLESQADVAAGV